MLLLLWGCVFGAIYTELEDPFNAALDNVRLRRGRGRMCMYLCDSLCRFVSITMLKIFPVRSSSIETKLPGVFEGKLDYEFFIENNVV